MGTVVPREPYLGQAGRLGTPRSGAFLQLSAELPTSLPACGSDCISTRVQLLLPQPGNLTHLLLPPPGV